MCRYLHHSRLKKRLQYFIEKAPDRSDQLHLGGYQDFNQYSPLVMINNMAEKRGEFEIWQHGEFVKVKKKCPKLK